MVRLEVPRLGQKSFAHAAAHAPPRVMVVAEIGVNHDGSAQRAVDLVQAARHAGADAVKFQLFDPRTLLSSQARLADYQQGRAGPENEVFAMLDRLKLSLDDLQVVRRAARALGLAFIVTPFSLEDVPRLRLLDVDAVKIASPDAVNAPLLRDAAALGKPMLISTGTAHLEELTHAAHIVRQQPARHRGLIAGRGCLLQCVSSYPTPIEDAALAAVAVLRQALDVPVGYSDHTTQLATGAMAVAAGACVIEKHLTYDRNATGPDHSASFDPDQFTQYVQLIRQAAAAMGPLVKSPRQVELDVRNVSRQSLCATRDLPAGHVLTRDDLTVKRPGTGVPAARLQQVLGQPLARPVAANCLLSNDDLPAAA